MTSSKTSLPGIGGASMGAVVMQPAGVPTDERHRRDVSFAVTDCGRSILVSPSRSVPHAFRLLVVAMFAGAWFGAEPVRADERLGHDEARRAVQSGEIRPLGDILAAIRDRMPGEVVAVELKRDHGRLIYELKTVDGAGRRREFHVDAASATISTEEVDD